MSGSTPAAKYAESIPAVTAPVKMPKLVPGRASYLAGVITGGVVGAVTLVLLGIAVSL